MYQTRENVTTKNNRIQITCNIIEVYSENQGYMPTKASETCSCAHYL